MRRICYKFQTSKEIIVISQMLGVFYVLTRNLRGGQCISPFYFLVHGCKVFFFHALLLDYGLCGLLWASMTSSLASFCYPCTLIASEETQSPDWENKIKRLVRKKKSPRLFPLPFRTFWFQLQFYYNQTVIDS